MTWLIVSTRKSRGQSITGARPVSDINPEPAARSAEKTARSRPAKQVKITLILAISLFLVSIPAVLAQSLLEQGILAFNLNDYEAAAKYLSDYLETNPYSQTGYEYLVNSYLALEQNRKALETLEKAVGYFPDAAQSYKLMGKIYAQMEQYMKSSQALEKYLRMSPDDYEAQSLLSTISYNCGSMAVQESDYYSALDYFNRAIELDSAYREAYRKKTAVLMELKDFEKAELHLQKAIERFARDDTFKKTYFDVLIRQNKYRQAMPVLEDIRLGEPENIDIALQLAVLYRYLNENEKAVNLYDSLIEKYPAERGIYDEIIEFWNNLNRQDKIRETYKLMLRTFPADREIQKNIALTYELDKNWQAAREKYDEMLSANPHDTEIRLLKTATFRRENNDEKAIESISEILAYDLTSYGALKQLGTIYDDQKSDNSLPLYRLLHESYPGDYFATYRLGRAFLLLDQLDSAEYYLKQARKSSSDEASPYIALGQIEAKRGNSVKAVDYHRQALNLAIKEMSGLQNQVQTDFISTGAKIRVDKLRQYEALQKRIDETEYSIEECMNYLKEYYTYNEYGAMLNAFLRQYPASAYLYLYQGIWHRDGGDMKQAILSLKKAISLNRGIIKPYEELASIYEMERDLNPALKSYRSIISIDDSNENAYDGIIRIYEELDDLDELCDEWLELYKSRPENEMLRDKLLEVLHKAERSAEAERIGDYQLEK